MTEEKKPAANPMGTKPVMRLLLTMAIPPMISMFTTSMYNIVDSMFVSWINEDALTAVSMCFPIQALILAFAIGTAVGIIAGNLLPLRAVSALSVALYGMFLAIIIPPARKSRVVAALVAISFALSFVCNYLPGISALSEGTRTILLTVLISSAAAVLFPVNPEEQEAEHDA